VELSAWSGEAVNPVLSSIGDATAAWDRLLDISREYGGGGEGIAADTLCVSKQQILPPKNSQGVSTNQRCTFEG
jgi:hypothetical protein